MEPSKNHYELDKHEFCERVTPDEEEYKMVSNELKKGKTATALVREIVRVKNPFLWSFYYCKKQAKMYDINKDPNSIESKSKV